MTQLSDMNFDPDKKVIDCNRPFAAKDHMTYPPFN